jgi:hypothetical protein
MSTYSLVRGKKNVNSFLNLGCGILTHTARLLKNLYATVAVQMKDWICIIGHIKDLATKE